MRLALIGCGTHSGRAHAPCLARYAGEHPGEVQLAAVCDLDRGRAADFAARYGFAAVYGDYPAMLRESRPDAVVCVMPVAQVAPVAADLLERGVPCVIEKPIATSPEAALQLAEVSRRTGTPHLVSFNRRFNPSLAAGRAWAAEAGPLRFVRGAMLRHRRIDPEFFWATALHLVDTLAYLAGEIEECRPQAITGPEMAAPWCVAALRFRGGCVGQLEILPTTGAYEETYELCGEDFRVRACIFDWNARPSLRCWRSRQLQVETVVPADQPEFLHDGSYEELCQFLHGLRDGTPLRPTIQDALHSTRVSFELAGQVAQSGHGRIGPITRS